MADTKISDMTDLTTLASGDEVPVADASDLSANKSFTLATLTAYLQGALGMPQIRTLTSAYTNSTTTGTEVTGLSFDGVPAGTYWVRWMLLAQSAATSTAFKFGVNFSGTTTRMAANHYFPSAGVTAATGTWHDANNATTGQVWAYANTRTETTTAPNLGPHIGVTTQNVDHFCQVEALFVVSDTGDIELWAASEVAASQITLSAGSSGILIRMA